MLRPRMDGNAYPQIPEISSTPRFKGSVGGAIFGEDCQEEPESGQWTNSWMSKTGIDCRGLEMADAW